MDGPRSESPRGGEVQRLAQLRDEAWTQLRQHMGKMTNSIEDGPARWVGNHPYVATSGAALAGFLAGLGGFGAGRQPKKKIPVNGNGHREPPLENRPADATLAWLEILLGLAESYFKPGAGEVPAGRVRVGDAGTVRGAAFPAAVWETAEETGRCARGATEEN